MACKGTCKKHESHLSKNKGIYKNGGKRCQVCQIWIIWDGKRCPCCNYRLREKPRLTTGKKYFGDVPRI